jgi:hypothetical protein
MKENARPSLISGGRYGLAHNQMTYPMGPSTDSYKRPSSDTSPSPASSSSRLSGKSPSPTRLLDLYYKYDPKLLLFPVLRVSQAQPLSHGLTSAKPEPPDDFEY